MTLFEGDTATADASKAEAGAPAGANVAMANAKPKQADVISFIKLLPFDRDFFSKSFNRG
jgi:hypothetical protein